MQSYDPLDEYSRRHDGLGIELAELDRLAHLRDGALRRHRLIGPKDTADWPEGVWTLPPSCRLKDVDRAKYAAIGESDRMTLKFFKPGFARGS